VALAQESGQEVRGIVVGEGGDRVRRADSLLHEELDVRAVPVDDAGTRELARELLVAAASPLEHRHGDVLGFERAASGAIVTKTAPGWQPPSGP
jgi:hypothetical protein